MGRSGVKPTDCSITSWHVNNRGVIVLTDHHNHRAALSVILALVAVAGIVSSTSFAAQPETLDRDIAILQKVLKQHPNADLYYRLGDLYVQKGRQTGDITYFNLANSSLREAINSSPAFEAAHRHLAFVLYSLHDFEGATLEAQQAVRLDPNDSYAYGVLGDAQLETGQYDECAVTYGKAVAINGDLYTYSRRSGLETIRGANGLALADLKRAIELGVRAGEPAEAIAWAQVTLAHDYFLMGKLDDAGAQAEAALRTDPGYHRAFAVLGEVQAAQRNFRQSADSYRRAIAVIPLPEYAAALADVETKLGNHEDALQQRQLVEFIAKLNVLNRVLYNRVLVDYYADHDIEHQAAVDLAASEFTIRHDIYGQDALAWALYRDGKARQALPHAIAALRFNTADARLYFHAGMINARLGRNRQARACLKRALEINPHFQPILDELAEHQYAVLNNRQPDQYADGHFTFR
jgi:tetratricopeptide (TPR) repeat protein